MENNKQNILSANRTMIDSKQLNVECVINLDNDQNIEKVLSLTAHTELKEQTGSEKETRFAGEVYLNLFYLTAENKIDSISSVCDYSDTLKHDALAEGQAHTAFAKIVGVTPSSASEDVLKVLVTVEIDFVLEGNTQVDIYENHDENCKVRLAGTNCVKVSSTYSASFETSKNLEVKEKVSKVLIASSNAVLKSATAHDGFVTVEGEVYNYLSYAKEDGSIVSLQASESFKEELEVEASTSDAMVYAKLSLNKKDIVVELDEQESLTSMKVTSPIKVDIKLYTQQEYLTVQDIYSLKNKLETNYSTVQTTTLLPAKYFEGKIEGSLTLSDNQPRIDKTLAVSNPRFVISNSYIKADEVFVEGIVSSNLVYLNDETESIHSVEVEVPFVTSEKYVLDNPNNLVSVQVALADCDMIAKRGREIYFDCKIKVYANVWQEVEQKIISNVQYKEPHREKDSAIEIYFAKQGDSFWDIAKELVVDEALVAGQNPSVKNPLENDEKIVVYYGIGK